MEDATLLKLSSEDFRELCNDYPSVILQAMNTLAKRSHHIIDTLAKGKLKKKHIAILPADDKVPLEKFWEKLREYTQALPEIVILSAFNLELRDTQENELEINKQVAEHAATEKVIIYLLNTCETALSRVCFENVDIIYVLGQGAHKPQLTGFVRDKIKDSSCKVKPELILLHDTGKRLPQNTHKWLKLADFQFNHHLRMNQPDDFQRLARFMTGKAVGLVLGGGGIRSWAHMGVLRALMESKVPIDFIAGTSGGAIVAAYYALHETYKDPHGILRELSVATTKTLSLTSLTWPAISISDSKYYTLQLQRIFSKKRIENLWRPFFCVSCNLTKNSAVIQRRGLIWQKIRSSSSIPGVFPPVVLKGKIYLDGGIVNNLPVDLMQQISDSIGTIIAVELIHTVPEEKAYNFPPILPFWKVILAKLRLGYKSYKFPHYIDTFLKSLLVGSSAKQMENSVAADILIRPDLSKFHLLNITLEQERELIKIGYKTTLRALKKHSIMQE
jgi:NTE family protein